MGNEAIRLQYIAIILGLFLNSAMLFAKKTSQAVYEDTFDIGAGGASLTMASSDAKMFANPAQLPYGGKFLRWLGLKTSFASNPESVDLLQGFVSGSSSDSDESTDTEAEGETDPFIQQLFKSPLHFGNSLIMSFLTNNGGIGVFYRAEPDIKIREFGETGLPEVRFQGEAYGGAVASAASRTYFRWLSFGATAKYLYVSEPDISIDVGDQEAIDNLSSGGGRDQFSNPSPGLGLDVGMLWFFQGENVDLRIAGKVDDLGGTQFSGSNPSEFKQTTHAGVGLTFHTAADAVHFALDYRDIDGVYEEKLFKRVYAGTKVTLRTYLGLAVGIYHGYPSAAVELDLIFLRLSAASFTREFGDSPGVDPRKIYIVSFATGFDF